MQHCYKVIIAKTKFSPCGNLEFAFLGFHLEKSCKSVVSPYIFTVNFFTYCGHSEGSEKHSFVGMWGGGGGGYDGPLWPTA